MLLIADEFVVNALRHTKSGSFEGAFAVEVRRWPDRVLIAVSDQGGPTEPVATEADELAESGRGLRTVAALADSWGWHGNERGRTVTAVFETGEALRLDGCSGVTRRGPWPVASGPGTYAHDADRAARSLGGVS
jgi:anti-sigma regulatory factor (Ser/Thr protein kinase)